MLLAVVIMLVTISAMSIQEKGKQITRRALITALISVLLLLAAAVILTLEVAQTPDFENRCRGQMEVAFFSGQVDQGEVEDLQQYIAEAGCEAPVRVVERPPFE